MSISLTTIIICIAVILFVNYHWSRRRLYILANKLPGPLTLPLIGNAYLFIGNSNDILLKIYKIVNKYTTPIKFWLGSALLIIFDQPQHVEKILSSSKVIYKHDVYDFMKPYAGEGMISGSGPKWKAARKLTQPMYNTTFVAESVKIFQQHVTICLNKLDDFVDKGVFNVESVLHKCSADMISETILGFKLNAQQGENIEVLDVFSELYDVIYPRIVKPWLHPNFIYNLTKSKTLQDKHIKILTKFFQNIVDAGKNAYFNNISLEITKEKNFVPSLVELTEKFCNNDAVLDEKDFRDNLVTIFAASEDTITAIASSALVCFGMYPEYQEMAFQEIQTVLGDTARELVTYEDITKLSFLDRCVKDVLRLFPIAPYIIRKSYEDFQIDKWTIPHGCALVIPIFNVHLNAKQWERPFDFYPDHFLPEAVKKRHAFSYIPFSAGLRGCIGKIFAQVSIKVLLVSILQQYVIEADGKYCDIYKQLKADISVRPKCGYKIRIKKRTYKKNV